MSTIKMDTNNMEKLIQSFENHVNTINEIFDSIEKNSKLIDGSTNIWKGQTQEAVYQSYNTVEESFPRISIQMNNYLKFVKKTLENYVIAETTIQKSANNEANDLNVN